MAWSSLFPRQFIGRNSLSRPAQLKRASIAVLKRYFCSGVEAAPIDLLHSHFATRGRREIAACFAQFEDGSYRHTILRNLEHKAGISAAFVAWRRITSDLIRGALDCIPAAHLRALFSRLLYDLRTHRSGLPDLIQLLPGERRYRMVEVKGPGDRLQDNQIQWLRFCGERGISVEVCRVRWADDTSTPSQQKVIREIENCT